MTLRSGGESVYEQVQRGLAATVVDARGAITANPLTGWNKGARSHPDV